MNKFNILILLMTFISGHICDEDYTTTTDSIEETTLVQETPSTTQTIPEEDKENITEANLNSFFDHNINLIRRLIYEKNLDPLAMPDRMLGLPDSLPMAKLHLRKGWVQQLATISRTGDVTARYNGRNLTVEFDLGWKAIDVNYDYTLKALFYNREGLFHGHFEDMRIRAEGKVNLETYKLELKFFRIIDAGHFSFDLSGHLSDYWINAIGRVVTTLAKDRILHEIEYHFVNSIREKIYEINELLPEPHLKKLF